ncbi:YoaK family protein [Streptomyces sp. NPDC002730]|uniref:YoaK family protein n=1 Tax=Streptomyces sp. NPDC002730 TaxID=3364662 RepID=UPI003696AEBC
METKPGPDLTSTPLTSLMEALTLTTGMVEAVSLLALGSVFTAMQTGNVLFFGFALVGEGSASAVATSVSLGSFAAGALLGARLESAMEARKRRWLVLALIMESALLAVAAFTAWGLVRADGAPSARHIAVVALVALAMGMRNVTAMRAHVPDLPTTLVTRTITALVSGSQLGHDTALGYGSGASARRGVAVLAMFTGGVLGAWLLHLHWSPTGVLLLVAAVVLAVAAAVATTSRHRPPPTM